MKWTFHSFADLRAAGYRFQRMGNCKDCDRGFEWWKSPENKFVAVDLNYSSLHFSTCTKLAKRSGELATHQCDAPGCTEILPTTRLMCLRHWRLVPKPIQNAVWAAYRNYLRDPRTNLKAHQAAKQAAIRSITHREGVASA